MSHEPRGCARARDLAGKLEALPEVAAAFEQGEISARHATVIASAFTPARAAERSPVEGALVDRAREHSPTELGGFVRYVTDAIDGDGGAATVEAAHDRRALFMSETTDGYDIRGGCDRATGLALHQALQAEMARDLQPHDARPAPMRRMDALANLGRNALNRAEVGEAHGIRPHITVVFDLGELPSLPGARTERTIAVPEGGLDGYLAPVTIEWLLCDCGVSRVVTAGASEVVDVGRETRTISAALWRALVVRDRHCTHPGCARGPDQCEAHHIVFWEHGGPTNLANPSLR